MQCKKCKSRKISWEIDNGQVIYTYDLKGNIIDEDFDCDSLVCPECAECGSTDLQD
jgi:hypothetical protein